MAVLIADEEIMMTAKQEAKENAAICDQLCKDMKKLHPGVAFGKPEKFRRTVTGKDAAEVQAVMQYLTCSFTFEVSRIIGGYEIRLPRELRW